MLFSRSSGFTLIEIMVSLAIIGVMATVAFTTYQQSQEQAKMARTQSKMRTIAQKMQEYRIDNSKLPGTGSGIDSALAALKAGKYISASDETYLLKDDWGTIFNYVNNDGVAGMTFSYFWTSGPNKTDNRTTPYTYTNGAKCDPGKDDWCLDLPFGGN